MKKIWFIVNKYPNITDPNVCVFIQQLVWSIADRGYECSVIVPMPVNFDRRYKDFPFHSEETTDTGGRIDLYYPKYISFGQAGKAAQKFRVKMTTDRFEKAVESVFSAIKEKPDIIYAHFLCPAAVAVARMGRKYNIPSFFAHGEATYSGDQKYGNAVLAKELRNINGVIAVSEQNKNYCVDSGIVPENKIKTFPNGYRKDRFAKKDKTEARKKFGFKEDDFIVGFCGSFDERKGVLRLQNAVDQIEGAVFACAGKGKLEPDSPKCIWKKPIENQELAWFYSAIDLFVLPTRNEGCCNAIVEAIACGCPIISSDRSFNYDICDESNSVLIDPNDTDSIRDAIIKLKNDNALREKLGSGSLEEAKTLTLEQRAKNILEFMDGAIDS